MLRHTICVVACLLLANTAFVYSVVNNTFNPIIRPESEDVARPGSKFLVTWHPTSTGIVSLFLCNAGKTTGIVIADSIQATKGQYSWSVPESLAANTTGTSISDVYQFTMRIYNGSLGLTTKDVGQFEETRTYDLSNGYFAISNDTKLTPLPPSDTTSSVPTSTVPLPNPTETTASTTIDASTTIGTSLTTKTTSGQNGAAPTRTPTFLSIVSEGHTTGFGYWAAGVVVWGIVIGGGVI